VEEKDIGQQGRGQQGSNLKLISKQRECSATNAPRRPLRDTFIYFHSKSH
jgi:hypothetical protein